jgi:hypothetical protein
MTAEGLLRAINAARLRALPEARAYELRHDVAPLPLTVAAGLAEPALIDPTPLAAPRAASTYWGPGKAGVWGVLLGVALLFWAWDAFLEDRWEALQLERRLRARREGRRTFSAAENLDLALQLLMIRGARQVEEQRAAAAEQELGWRPLNAQPAQPPVAPGTAQPTASEADLGGGVWMEVPSPPADGAAPGDAPASPQATSGSPLPSAASAAPQDIQSLGQDVGGAAVERNDGASSGRPNSSDSRSSPTDPAAR